MFPNNQNMPQPSNPHMSLDPSMAAMQPPAGQPNMPPFIDPSQSQVTQSQQWREQYQEHFQNLVPILDAEDIDYLKREIWPRVEKAKKENENIKNIYADFIPVLAATIPQKGNTGKANGGDDAVRNSGSIMLYSSAFLEGLLNVGMTVLSILLMGDKKIEAQFASHLANRPGTEATAKRIRNWCDSYFTKGMLRGYKDNLLLSVMWAILNGDAVRKVFEDPTRGNPRAGLILPGNFFFTENNSKNFYEMKGFVHKFRISHAEMMSKIDKGIWSNAFTSLVDDEIDDGTEELEEALARQKGLTKEDEIGENASDSQRVYNGYSYYNELDLVSDPLRDEGKWGALPYMVVFGDGGIVTEVKRQWYWTDPLRFATQDFVHYRFLPSLDDGSYGLAHVAGEKARAATVLQRQLVDSAQLANVSTGFFKPYGRQTNRQFDLKSGQYQPLGGADDDIRKSIYTIPYNPPNPVVMQLLQTLEDDIRKFSHVVNENLINLTTQAPAMASLALLSRMEQLPNIIVQGCYDSFCEELRIFKRKFYEWLEPNQMFSIEWQGEILEICREDFSPGIEIVPCGKFSMESDAYRLTRSQLILNEAQTFPQFHNTYFILKNLYKEIGYSEEDINQMIVDPNQHPSPPPIPSREPVAENSCMLTGQPVQAYLGQDHKAHRMVHALLMQHPDPSVQAAAAAHDKHHEALEMMEQLQAMSGIQLPPDTEQLPLEQQNAIAVEMAKAALELEKQRAQQQGQPQQPIDPAIVAFEEMKVQRENAQLDAEVQLKKIEMEREKSMIKSDLEMAALRLEESKNERENLRLEKELQQAEFDMQIRLKELEIKEKEHHIDHLDGEIRNLRAIVDMQEATKEEDEEEEEEVDKQKSDSDE